MHKKLPSSPGWQAWPGGEFINFLIAQFVNFEAVKCHFN
jgi:hypothetical protein